VTDKAYIVKDNIGLAGAFLFVAGLFFSPFILSFSLAILILQPFFDSRIRSLINNLLKQKVVWLFLLLFAWYCIGFLYTSDVHDFLKDINLKLPYLILPLAFVSGSFKKGNSLLFILTFLNFCTFVAGTLSFINYLLHRGVYDQLIFEAKPIPIITGINHIYYSVILAFSVISGLLIALDKKLPNLWRMINLVLSASGLIFLHTISARTGLLGFYVSAFILLVWRAFSSGKFRLTFIAIILFIGAGIASLKYIEVLNNRLQKTIEDINVYREGGNINHYSLSMRLEYWDKTYKVFKKSPVIGVGNADVDEESAIIYDEENSSLLPINRKNAHNQFLQLLAGTGLIGFALFLTILFFAFRNSYNKKDGIGFSFLIIVLIAFFFESLLERQVGISFFTFFLLLHGSET